MYEQYLKKSSYIQLMYPFRKKKKIPVNFCSECDGLLSASMDIGRTQMRTKHEDTFLMVKKKRTQAEKRTNTV